MTPVVAAVASAFGSIALAGAASRRGEDGSDGTWLLWAAAILLFVAMLAFLIESEGRNR